jgi:hypothetical protein
MNDSSSVEFNLFLISSQEILYFEFKFLTAFTMKRIVAAGK